MKVLVKVAALLLEKVVTLLVEGFAEFEGGLGVLTDGFRDVVRFAEVLEKDWRDDGADVGFVGGKGGLGGVMTGHFASG